MSASDSRSPPVLRDAVPDDFARLAAIDRQSNYSSWTETAFAASFANAQILLISCHPSEADGFVVFRVHADESEILNIAVSVEARGRGLGARLLDAALLRAGAMGASACFLEVRESNLAAIALYRSRGFEAIARRSRYYRATHGREDAIVMRRDTGGSE